MTRSATRNAAWCLVVAIAVATVIALAGPTPARGAAAEYCRGEQLVEGANWSVCWEIRALEGLAITHAFYTKDGFDHRVLSDATVAQVFVPYESGQPRYHEVAYGLGLNLQALDAANECPGGKLLDGGRVCSSVEDRGIVERFCAAGGCISRRGQALVLWSSAEMGTSNYLIRWAFRDDGTIEPAVGLTGALMSGDAPHTHNVFWRLDLDIDGPADDQVEEFYRVSPATSDGSTGVAGWVPLDTETYRAVDLASFRKWRVRDTAATNSHGLALSYELVPSPRDGTLRTTAAEGFMRGELWVTRAKPGERYVSTDQADLLSSYVNGESVAGTDVVLWYAMHSYHEVRSEDRPVLPVEWMTFQVRPRDFFDADPAP